MGIRGLTGWIRWAASETICTPNWAALQGKKIGIDILGFLYKAKSLRQCPLLYLANMIARFRQLEIIPIMVFDGKPPSEKKNTLRKRTETRLNSETKAQHLESDIVSVTMSDYQRSIIELELSRLRKDTCYLTSEERDVAKQLFYACGVLSLNASGEADNLLSYFAKNGYIAAVISNDMDLLARGVENLYVPDVYTLPGDPTGWSHYSLSSILKHVSLSYTQFVEMCVIMGCDYTLGYKSLPYRSAYWSIKYRGNLARTLYAAGVKDCDVYDKAYTLLCGTLDDSTTIMGEKQWDKWDSGAPPIEPGYLSLMRKNILVLLSDVNYELLLTPDTDTAADVRITIQNVPIVNMNNIRNNIADNKI